MPLSTPNEPSPAVQELRLRLEAGQLEPVGAVIERVLGEAISGVTLARWCEVGRAGIRIPTVRGARLKRLTTESAFRHWLSVTSDLVEEEGCDDA